MLHSHPSILEALTTESFSQENTIVEIEREWYLLVTDFDQLERASSTEHQEQWEYRLHQGDVPIGTLRSRMIDQSEFELTIKTYKSGIVGRSETNIPSNKDTHEVIASLSDRVLRKIRYIFPVTISHMGEEIELKWEVDVFIDSNGNREPWVKIDLELPHEGIMSPPFPIQGTTLINNSFDAKPSDDERKTIDNIYKRITSVA